MTNGDEHARHVELLFFTISSRFNAYPGDAGIVTQNFFQCVIPFDTDIAIFGLFKKLVLENLFRAQAIPAMSICWKNWSCH